MTSWPIILLDDDTDDLEMMRELLQEIDPGREVIVFSSPIAFLEYARANDRIHLFILSDVNMGGMDGLELKRIIHEEEPLSLRCMPFIFFSTTQRPSSVETAFSCNAQGFFIKPNSVQKLRLLFETLITYWSLCLRPYHAPTPQVEHQSKD